MSNDERAKFEAWAVEQGYDIERVPTSFTSSSDRNGRYQSYTTNYAWEAWEARSRG